MPATRQHVLTTRVTKNAHRAILKIRADTGWTTSEIVNRAIRHYIRTGDPSAEHAQDEKISGEGGPDAG